MDVGDWNKRCQKEHKRFLKTHRKLFKRVRAFLEAETNAQWIEGMEEVVGIAAINGPSSVTISGDKDAIQLLANRLEDAGVFCRRLAVEYAFHSPQMEPVREELLRSLEHIEPCETRIPLISTVTGR